MTRVANLASHNMFLSRMISTQESVYKSQMQLYSEQVSNTYSGISSEASRLVNMENERDRAQSYITNNSTAKLRLETMALSVESAESLVRDFRNLVQQFSNRDLMNIGADDQSEIDDLQTRAFDAMQDLEYFLNQKVDGRYLFSGGRVTTPPVEIEFKNLEQFQNTYNGEDVRYPTTRAAQLSNFIIDDDTTGGVSVQQTGPDVGVITATNANGMIVDSISGSATTTGNMAFDLANNEMRANVENAFANLEPGGTVVVSGTVGNDGVYIVKDVSPDGRIVEFDTSTPVAANENIANGTGVDVGRTYPIGSKITMNSVDPLYDGDYTITGVNAANQLEVRTNSFPGVAANFPATGIQSFTTKAYYEGDNLSLTHRVSETRTVEFSFTAKDPAFEKAFRAMGIIAQDNLFDTTGTETQRAHDRVMDALALLDDALANTGTLENEEEGSLTNTYYTIDMYRNLMENTIERQNDYIGFLDTRIADIEYMDPTIAAAQLNEDMQSLEISYSVMAKSAEISLLNYI